LLSGVGDTVMIRAQSAGEGSRSSTWRCAVKAPLPAANRPVPAKSTRAPAAGAPRKAVPVNRRYRGRLRPPAARIPPAPAAQHTAGTVRPRASNEESPPLVSPAVTVRLLRELSATRPAPDAGSPLTDRELDVARLIAVGRTNQEICEHLVVSLSTVKTHLADIQQKIDARNRVEIAAWAWESGRVRKR
jgi:DNA-binding CsgD family transcriptional regulator